jgi:fibronectin type 3 domain-containing protein
MSAGQTLPLTVVFTPRASGAASGSISLASNAAHTPTVETLTGSGVAAANQHSVILSWTASASSVVGYNVYRSGTSGGPYTKLTTTLDAGTNYVDNSVQGGQTYYYVNTAVDSHGVESKYSTQLRALIPSP